MSAAVDPSLRASYRACRRLQRRHDPTFYVATRCLSTEVRPAVHALYAFVRRADELVDGRDRPSPGLERRAALDAWQTALEDGLREGGSPQPIVAALIDAGRRHELPLHLLPRYLDSMRIDCDEPVRLRDRAALDHYMEGSAATVGRIMAPLLGVPAGEHERVARLGVAFQLTNFIRDVPIDWRLGRVYLPDLPEPDLRCGRAGDDLRSCVAREVGRARALFAEAGEVTATIGPAARKGVRVACAVYARVLDRVERHGFDVLARSARLPPWEAASAAIAALRR